jgi:C-terminal processing protease CtpA/Prc
MEANVIQTAFMALVTSAAPAEPRNAAKAALAAASRAVELPASFGSDLPRDGEWLAQQLEGVSSPWPSIEAMAWSASIPHTVLVTPDMRAAMMAMRSGVPPIEPGFLMHTLPDGRIVVSDVAPGCSAAASGLRVGDVIVTLEGVAVERPVARLMRMFRLAPGTELPVKLVRKEGGETVDVALRLAQGTLPLVESRLLRGSVGHIFLRAFTASEDPERDLATLVRRALQGMPRDKLRGVVLDVRSNPGGNSEGAARTASVLAPGAPMISLRGTDGKVTDVPRFGEPVDLTTPIVVLVDDQSSSSAEMFTLALREHAKARVVGQDTAGALTMPAMLPLRDGFGLMTPGSRCLGPVTREPFTGDRIAVDVRVPCRTPEDFIAGRDAQLDAALELLA